MSPVTSVPISTAAPIDRRPPTKDIINSISPAAPVTMTSMSPMPTATAPARATAAQGHDQAITIFVKKARIAMHDCKKRGDSYISYVWKDEKQMPSLEEYTTIKRLLFVEFDLKPILFIDPKNSHLPDFPRLPSTLELGFYLLLKK
jgi:hypothetical protein